MSSLKYLIETYKCNRDNLFKDKKTIECLKYLSCMSLTYRFSEEDPLTEDYFNLLFDLVFKLIKNLRVNYDFNLFKINNSSKENILMLTRLVGTILNYSNNCIYFASKLNEKTQEINDFFQIIYRIIKSLEKLNENYNQLICFCLTSLDFLIFYFESSKNLQFDSDIRLKLTHLSGNNLLNKLYSDKIKYCLIRFDYQSDLDNQDNKRILSDKYNDIISYFANHSIEIHFTNQFCLNSFKFLKLYASINPIKYDLNLTKLIIKKIDKEILKASIKKSNLNLLFEILLNYSTRNVEFVKEFQELDNSVQLLFNCLEILIRGEQTKHNYVNLVETLINLIYFTAKQSHLYKEKWIGLNNYLFEILENDSFQHTVVSDRVTQIIKITHSYTDFEVMDLNENSLFEYLSVVSIEPAIFSKMTFRDAVIFLFNLTETGLNFDNLTDSNKKVLVRFLADFINYSSEYILKKSEKTLADNVKLFSYTYDILSICCICAFNSSEFCNQFQSKCIPLLIYFMLDGSLEVNKNDKVNYYLNEKLRFNITKLIFKIILNTTHVSSSVLNKIETIESLLESSIKFSERIVYQTIELVACLHGYTKNEKLYDYLKFYQLDHPGKMEYLNLSFQTIFCSNLKLEAVLENRNCLELLIELNCNNDLYRKIDSNLYPDFIKFSIDYFEFSLNALNEFNYSCFDYSVVVIMKILFYFNEIMTLNCNIANTSVKFCSKFHKNAKNGISILMKILTDEKIYDNIASLKLNFLSTLLNKAFDVTLLTLHNLSRIAYRYRPNWEETSSDLLIVLFNLANKYKQINESFQLTFYLIIANLASDDDVINFADDIKQVLKSIVDKLATFATILENENSDEIDRIQISLNESDETKVSVIQFDCWHLIEVI